MEADQESPGFCWVIPLSLKFSILVTCITAAAYPAHALQPLCTPPDLPVFQVLQLDNSSPNSSDEQYGIYRKGLITRHITRNGRLLEAVALKNIDPVIRDGERVIVKSLREEDFKYDCAKKSWTVLYPDGHFRPINLEEVRYASTKMPPTFTLNYNMMWVPVRGPVKVPGAGNGIYEGIAGGGDNPLYYGGMALATFALEHRHRVSDHSLNYARRLVRFMLDSEMNGENGYLVREARVWNSVENYSGTPQLRGASSEELLGTMFGLMLYLQEEAPSHPLYAKARALQGRILQTVKKGHWWDSYEHPHMLASKEKSTSFYVKHYQLAFEASVGNFYVPDTNIAKFYLKPMTTFAGNSYPAAIVSANTLLRHFTGGWSKPLGWELSEDKVEHWTHAMNLLSMLLVLESPLDNALKAVYAEIFMRDYIKAALTAGVDRAQLQGNAFLAATALMTAKYISEKKLKEIWKGDWAVWERLKTWTAFVHPEGCMPIPFSDPFKDKVYELPAQLPLMRYSGASGNPPLWSPFWVAHQNYAGSKRSIGDWFAWRKEAPYKWEGDDTWFRTMPGYFVNSSWPKWVTTGSLAEFRSGTEKRYSSREFANYISGSPVSAPTEALGNMLTQGHTDLQVEGAGLDLLFVRMLLAEANPQCFPPPKIRWGKPNSGYDRNYPPLATDFPTPLGVQLMHYAGRLKGANIEGDRPNALRIRALQDSQGKPTDRFVVAYPAKGEQLTLAVGRIAGGGNIELGPTTTAGRFDEVELELAVGPDGSNFVVVIARAEHQKTAARDEYRLAISLWRVDNAGLGKLKRVADWRYPDADPDAAKYIAAAMVGPTTGSSRHLVVTFRSRNDSSRIKVFELRLGSAPNYISGIVPLEQTAEDAFSKSQADTTFVTATRTNVVVSATPYDLSTKYSVVSRVLCGAGAQAKFKQVDIEHKFGRLVALGTVRGTSGANQGKDYIVAASSMAHQSFLSTELPYIGWQLQLIVWQINPDGSLLSKGTIDTSRGEELLLNPEWNWGHGEFVSVDFEGRPGFALVGKGAARSVRRGANTYDLSNPGMKVLYGYIMDDDRPTLVSSNVFGAGDPDAMKMFDVTGAIKTSTAVGLVTTHKTDQSLLNLLFWEYRNEIPAALPQLPVATGIPATGVITAPCTPPSTPRPSPTPRPPREEIPNPPQDPR